MGKYVSVRDDSIVKQFGGEEFLSELYGNVC